MEVPSASDGDQAWAAAAKKALTWLVTPVVLIPPAALVDSSTTKADEPSIVAFMNCVAVPVQLGEHGMLASRYPEVLA